MRWKVGGTRERAFPPPGGFGSPVDRHKDRSARSVLNRGFCCFGRWAPWAKRSFARDTLRQRPRETRFQSRAIGVAAGGECRSVSAEGRRAAFEPRAAALDADIGWTMRLSALRFPFVVVGGGGVAKLGRREAPREHNHIRLILRCEPAQPAKPRRMQAPALWPLSFEAQRTWAERLRMRGNRFEGLRPVLCRNGTRAGMPCDVLYLSTSGPVRGDNRLGGRGFWRRC